VTVEVHQLGKYLLASALALLVDYSCYWSLASLLCINLAQAALAGYCAGLAVAYLVISQKVFAEGWLRSKRYHEAALFLLSGLFGMALTYSTVAFYVSQFGEQVHGAKLSAVAVSFVGVYAFRRYIVFAEPRKKPMS
jgi:putative flippase GtrA